MQANSSQHHFASRGLLIAVAIATSTSLALGACGTSTSSNPTTSASPSTSPNTPVCRVPVTAMTQSSTQTLGFLDLETGDFRAQINLPANARYVRPLKRWIAVPASAHFRPDGQAYAYAADQPRTANTGPYPDAIVHVVDIKTGDDRPVTSAAQWGIVAYTGEGIYLGRPAIPGGTRGLWRLDPATGVIRQLDEKYRWWQVRDGAAWAFALEMSVTEPFAAHQQGGTNELLRLDLATGAISSWLYLPDEMTLFLAFDQQGHPVVNAFSATMSHVLVVTAPNTAHDLVSAPAGWDVGQDVASPGFLQLYAALDTTDGIWLQWSDAVWLVDDFGRRLVTTPLPPNSTFRLDTSWGCV